jgi:integrase
MQTKNRKNISELVLRALKPREKRYLTWDARVRGLCVATEPTGRRTWKFMYSYRSRTRWFTIGDADAISISDARTKGNQLIGQVASDCDPQSDRRARREAITFQKLSERYVAEYAQQKNKSWKQSAKLIQRRVLPKLGHMAASAVVRADIRDVLAGLKPGAFNSTLHAISAIYSWAMREEIVAANPCTGIEVNATQIRQRVLSDAEVPLFWNAFDDHGLIVSSVLKVLLLTGQRSSEVLHMRREHLKEGWWTLPGAPQAELKWPGVKNKQTHKVWLSHAVQQLIADLDDGSGAGFVFAGERGGIHSNLDGVMRDICTKLGITDFVTPHDLRRTFSTAVVSLGHSVELMDRVTNHVERSKIRRTYNQHQYEAETKVVMESVANHFAALVAGEAKGKVVAFRK